MKLTYHFMALNYDGESAYKLRQISVGRAYLHC